MAQISYLYKVNQIYYFRIRIPKDLQKWFEGREDHKRSLKTKVLTSAKTLCNLWAGKTERLFTIMRTEALTNAQIKKLAAEYLVSSLEDSDELRVLGGHQLADCGDFVDTAIPYEEHIESANNDILSGTWDYIGPLVDSFLEKKDVQVDKKSFEYKNLCRDIALAHIEVLKTDRKRDLGDFTDEYFNRPSEGDAPVAAPSSSGKDSLKFSQLIQKFLDENNAQGNWKGKSADQVSGRLNLILEMVGDVNVDSLTRDDCVQCLNDLRRFPSNRNKRKEYKDKTVREILALKEIDNPLGETTIKHHMESLSSLFKWAALHSHMDKNPAAGLAPRPKKAADEERLAYSQEDLQKIVTLIKREKRPERQWIPLVGMYSGLRLNEICQLYKQDISQIKGVWCFDINDAKDKELKTPKSKRRVPVHPELIRLGLLEYVDGVDHERVWPNLERGRDGYSDAFQKWYGRFKKKHITEDSRKVFHSFRHNFTDALKQAGVQEQLIGELVGHSSGSITMERYGKVFRAGVLLEALEKLGYGLDL